MRFPQVTDRVKEAPAHALRAMFAGIGQVLLVADRMRSRPASQDPAQRPAATGQAATGPAGTKPAGTGPAGSPPAEPQPAAVQAGAEPAGPAAPRRPGYDARRRRLDRTGNVTILPAERPEQAAGPASPPPAQPDPAAAGTGSAALPVPGYDQLSIASLRARLRILSPAQLRELLAYERANAARPDVVSMFERRVAKLESGQD